MNYDGSGIHEFMVYIKTDIFLLWVLWKALSVIFMTVAVRKLREIFVTRTWFDLDVNFLWNEPSPLTSHHILLINPLKKPYNAFGNITDSYYIAILFKLFNRCVVETGQRTWARTPCQSIVQSIVWKQIHVCLSRKGEEKNKRLP